MHVLIVREYDPIKDKHYLLLYADGKFVTSEDFRIHEPDESIYNEKKCLEKLTEMAKRIEQSGSIERIKEVVYESK